MYQDYGSNWLSQPQPDNREKKASCDEPRDETSCDGSCGEDCCEKTGKTCCGGENKIDSDTKDKNTVPPRSKNR